MWIEHMVDFIAQYATIPIGEMVLADIFGVASLFLIVGILLGMWSKNSKNSYYE